MTRAQALKGLAAVGALPIMPSISGVPSAQDLNTGRDLTAIFGSTAFVGSDLTPLHDATILIRGERVEAVGPAHEVAIPASAFRIDATGLFTIPGLIDSHVHFFQSGSLYTRPDAIDLRSVRPYTDEIQWIRSNLQDTFARYLRAGITSVVDAGGPFWNYDVRTQSQQTPVSPRVMVAGPLDLERRPQHSRSVQRSSDREDRLGRRGARFNRPRNQRANRFCKVLVDRDAGAARRRLPADRERRDRVRALARRARHHPRDAARNRAARGRIGNGYPRAQRLRRRRGRGFPRASAVAQRDLLPDAYRAGQLRLHVPRHTQLTSNDLRVANPDAVGTLLNMQNVESALAPDVLERIRAMRPTEPPYVAMRNLKRVHEAGIRIALEPMQGTSAPSMPLHSSTRRSRWSRRDSRQSKSC